MVLSDVIFGDVDITDETTGEISANETSVDRVAQVSSVETQEEIVETHGTSEEITFEEVSVAEVRTR